MKKFNKYLIVLALVVAFFAILGQRIELHYQIIGVIFTTGFIWLVLYLSEDLGRECTFLFEIKPIY